MEKLNDSEKEFYRLAGLTENGVDLETIQSKIGGVGIEDVANMVNKLSKLGMIEICQIGSAFTYRAIKSEDMEKMLYMEPEEALIYKQIMAAKDQGIWVRSIKYQTNLHQQIINRCLKTLEGKNMIKSIKSVKNPTKKLYMLIDIKPSVEVSGGPWFTDQELDVDFIEQLSKQCHRYIYSRSTNKANPIAIYSANYLGYPTALQIRKFIMDNKISTVDLSIEDIKCLLDILVYDGKIERLIPYAGGMMGSRREEDIDWVYRALSIQEDSSPLSEIPCGNCPVYSTCSDDGVISPASCTYFKKWLSF
ncbi:hypothetical protein BB559_002609 [Furculomyces boomerangus]|uniref:DNA-directed RNA polymerase III subunit RPC6 n=2 Tax=Harpellales TaxID=61421 RepID=A0A2T9YTX0_9FUNG|nr:hypothetical protein BB559_002609 [Furculomyces boomerangus]PVZ98323.1 hypothetical protein BB558_005669 [Smittium angustum]